MDEKQMNGEKQVNREKQMNRIKCLKQTVDTVLQKITAWCKTNNDSGNSSVYYENLKVYLENMRDDLNKFEKLVKGDRKPTVGVFGCPSRGKSTLLNVLLGVDMLPMKGKPGTTRFGIELSYKNTKEFRVTVNYNSKPPTIYEDVPDDDKSVGFILSKHSGKSSLVNPDISRIEVQGPFRSFLGNDIVFIDTPGVELGAGDDDTAEGSPVDHDFKADKNRALAILSSVDVVIFCMINKYKEKKDADFYEQEIMEQYNPINVITAGDKRDEEETNDDIKEKVQKDYGLLTYRTVVVSAKEALEKIRAARTEGKEISQMVASEFKGENLEEFMNLSEKILKETENTEVNIENRIRRFEEFYESLRKDAKEKNIDIEENSSSWQKSADKVFEKGEEFADKVFEKGEEFAKKVLKNVPKVKDKRLSSYLRKHKKLFIIICILLVIFAIRFGLIIAIPFGLIIIIIIFVVLQIPIKKE